MVIEPNRPAIIVAVCTYQRNEALGAMLDGVLAVAEYDDSYAIGVVVVDDTAAGLARPVVDRYAGRFELGIRYAISGHRNISLARNLALETALQRADWIAMTDDDCVPIPQWVQELLRVQRTTGATVVSGPEVRVASADAPRWLTEQPFLAAGLSAYVDGAPMTYGSTHNALISAAWLRSTDLRFEPDLGTLGGEDMVFFKAARASGAQIHYARAAAVHETQPPERETFRYQLRSFWWLGNSQYVTSTRSNTTSGRRMLVHGAAELARALLLPARNLMHRRAPQLRFALASAVRSCGIIAGACGVRVDHH